jgi:hypothetical protein
MERQSVGVGSQAVAEGTVGRAFRVFSGALNECLGNNALIESGVV